MTLIAQFKASPLPCRTSALGCPTDRYATCPDLGMCKCKEHAMKQWPVACIVLLAGVTAGCTQPFSRDPGAPLSINRAPAEEVMAKQQQGTTPEAVGATTGSGGGEVGFEYW